MIICDTGVVVFPSCRKEQSADLMALAGDALMSGDRIAWKVLYAASRLLDAAPEPGTPEYESENRRIGEGLAQTFGVAT